MQKLHVKFAAVFVVLLCMATFTTVAGTNLAVLGLLLAAPFAWFEFRQTHQTIEPRVRLFLWLIVLICVWDVFTNVYAGYALGLSLKTLMHDMRTFGFVLLLWAVFANPYLARVGFFAMLIAVLVLASANLWMKLTGQLSDGQYFCKSCSHMSHMYGQALVGLFFVLAQMWLVRPGLSWRVLMPMAILVVSLFLASERRTGYLLMAVGFGFWTLLNYKRIFSNAYKWWLLAGAVGIVFLAGSSEVVHSRIALAVLEFNDYVAMAPEQRAAVVGAVRIRMQYMSTAIEVIKDSNWWIGVGSLKFPELYRAAAIELGVTPETMKDYNWENPHNEYILMLATKGVVGLALYLAIFAQACRVAWGKTDEVQRVGLVMFVFLFMLSITTNSMMIDMEEGHFTMAILLIFLAPKSLDLIKQK